METFAALVEPNRRRILDAVRDRPQTVNMLVDLLGLSQPAVSKHLKVLREAGLVVVRPDGQRRWYKLKPRPLIEVDEWLRPYRQFWADKRDGLERHLNEEKENNNE